MPGSGRGLYADEFVASARERGPARYAGRRSYGWRVRMDLKIT